MPGRWVVRSSSTSCSTGIEASFLIMAQAGSMGSVLPPIHRAGWPFIAAFFVVSLLLGWLWTPLFWLGLLATAWCTYFFRDPARVTPTDPALVVSPADGLVV